MYYVLQYALTINIGRFTTDASNTRVVCLPEIVRKTRKKNKLKYLYKFGVVCAICAKPINSLPHTYK